jgi:hypothetical protein
MKQHPKAAGSSIVEREILYALLISTQITQPAAMEQQKSQHSCSSERASERAGARASIIH